LELPNAASQPLPRDLKIGQLFDQEDRALLILGEPGSGKTITLLELARDLVARAENDAGFSQAVPVVFNLSTWVDRHQPLIDWMVNELWDKYRVPKKIGKPWLENNRILPLLDGLDEVKQENRAACVLAINKFEQDFGLAGLAVSCRLQDYTNLPVRLKLNAAICLQPLTARQVDDYLAAFGPRQDVLRQVLKNDEALMIFAQSPLLLSIMSLAYEDAFADALANQSSGTAEERRRHLFDTYVERMFKRKGQHRQRYSDEQTKKWLTWLAQEMTRHEQPIFLIEQLQPSWLTNRTWRWVYVLGSRTITGALLFVFAPDFMIIVPGAIGGLCLGIMDALRFEKSSGNPARKVPARLQTALNVFGVGLLYGLVVGLSFELLMLISGWLNIGSRQNDALSLAILGGLSGGLVFGLRKMRRNLTTDIQTVETLNWSWRGALKGGRTGAVIGALVSAVLEVLELMFGYNYAVTDAVLMLETVLLIAQIGALFGALFGGLSSRIIDIKAMPNQGIWLSLRNAILAALLIGLIGGLFFVLGSGLSYWWIGLPLVVWAALWFGGLDVIQHFLLRLVLWRTSNMPWNYARFLDYAAERIFLRKVGGGYMFVHRLLMEYFAAMSETQGKG
jgi:eukaryotic-like serine/threonine-protein kinase